MASEEGQGGSGRTLTHLVSYMSDSDEERPKDEVDERDGEGEAKEKEVEMKDEDEEEQGEVFEATEAKPVIKTSASKTSREVFLLY